MCAMRRLFVLGQQATGAIECCASLRQADDVLWLPDGCVQVVYAAVS